MREAGMSQYVRIKEMKVNEEETLYKVTGSD